MLASGLAALYAYLPGANPTLAATAGSSMLDRCLLRLAPYPAKRRLITAGQFSAHLSARSNDSLSQSAITGAGNRIIQTARWRSGSNPNYTATALIDGQRFIWAACFNSRSVTQLNASQGTTASFDAGSGMSPLDVAYDATRNRLVVASADQEAHFSVIDLNRSGEVIARYALAPSAGQVPCDGGAQGVAVDAHGDYWFTLAYSGQTGRGAVVKVNGKTLQPALVVKDLTPAAPLEGLSNPNGIVTGDDGRNIYTFSDTGRAHHFDLDGTLLRTFTTVSTGYRGAVRGRDMWVAAWYAPKPGEYNLTRIDLNTGERTLHTCIPLANSAAIDERGRVWVAGDAGLSVNESDGSLLAAGSFDASLNGLAIGDGCAYTTAYAYASGNEDSLLRFTLAGPRIRIPAILFSGGTSP